jgi:hypothetical protein
MMWVAPAPHFDLTMFILLKDIYQEEPLMNVPSVYEIAYI